MSFNQYVSNMADRMCCCNGAPATESQGLQMKHVDSLTLMKATDDQFTGAIGGNGVGGASSATGTGNAVLDLFCCKTREETLAPLDLDKLVADTHRV